jgi:hypothetical protein
MQESTRAPTPPYSSTTDKTVATPAQGYGDDSDDFYAKPFVPPTA